MMWKATVDTHLGWNNTSDRREEREKKSEGLRLSRCICNSFWNVTPDDYYSRSPRIRKNFKVRPGPRRTWINPALRDDVFKWTARAMCSRCICKLRFDASRHALVLRFKYVLVRARKTVKGQSFNSNHQASHYIVSTSVVLISSLIRLRSLPRKLLREVLNIPTWRDDRSITRTLNTIAYHLRSFDDQFNNRPSSKLNFCELNKKPFQSETMPESSYNKINYLYRITVSTFITPIIRDIHNIKYEKSTYILYR